MPKKERPKDLTFEDVIKRLNERAKDEIDRIEKLACEQRETAERAFEAAKVRLEGGE